MKRRGLVWFKNDLRLHDNEALVKAHEECSDLVCCYCIEKSDFDKSDLAFRKKDTVRFKFMQQSVLDLRKSLESMGGHLVVGEDSAMVTLPQLVEEYGITDVYAEEEYAQYEINLADAVMDALPAVKFHFFWGKTLYHKDDIPFKISRIPLTSKAYRIPAGRDAEPRETLSIPAELNFVASVKTKKFPSYKLYGFNADEYKDAAPFVEGGETAALKRLEYYTFKSELLTGYRWSRNKSDGLDYSSKLSPYLALGCISAREIYKKVKDYESEIKKNQSTWWLIFELVWRDYFTFKGMRFGTAIFKTKGYKNKKIDWENDPLKFE
ncbi:MAG: deoxyribodipyrimidine photo-lyase, partial [Pedobacter sp.]|uniref:deoxyribodipyrimidine photo-lyase n=1 Tax=Pedobacter sp. TaxID=1411316 RepID=UPI003392FB08